MSDLPDHHEDHPEVVSHNARMGLVLFLLYFALYVAFLLVNVFSPETMRLETKLGPNFAVVTGMGLILFAFIFALIYMGITKGSSSGEQK